MYLNGTFAIYPTASMEDARDSAVIFCDDIDIAKRLCDHMTEHYGTHHSAVLRMPSWSDPRLIHNLNGCENVSFSVRDPHAAEKASFACKKILGKDA